MNDSSTKARLVFLIKFLKWYFSKYWQVQTRRVFAQTVTHICIYIYIHWSNVVPFLPSMQPFLRLEVHPHCPYQNCSWMVTHHTYLRNLHLMVITSKLDPLSLYQQPLVHPISISFRYLFVMSLNLWI